MPAESRRRCVVLAVGGGVAKAELEGVKSLLRQYGDDNVDVHYSIVIRIAKRMDIRGTKRSKSILILAPAVSIAAR